MWSHLVGLVPTFGLLLVWLVWRAKREELPFVDRQGKESLNSQITMWVAFVSAAILSSELPTLVPPVLTYGLVMMIVAAAQACHGVEFRHPIAIRAVR